jgi:uncharacterized protein with GYD domain
LGIYKDMTIGRDLFPVPKNGFIVISQYPATMPNYIILFNFTEHGIKNVKDTINRAEAFKNAVEKAGGKFLSEYYTFGRYDIVTTVEVPSDESMMSIMLVLAGLATCEARR